MTAWIANARMYAVAPAAEAAWRELLGHIADDAGVPLAYTHYPAPLPLEELWRRPDLGAVFMCGYPIALRLATVTPLAAPIPALPWAAGRAVYRSDLIVRADSPFRTLADTFGHRAGWTVAHSHSGFNAFRHHLLPHRSPERPALYGEMHGDLVTARRVLDAVVDGTIDVGPLDAYWHALLARHRPELVADIRVLESTDLAPAPAFVAAPLLAAGAVDRLRAAFAGAALAPWFPPLGDALCLAGFSRVTVGDYAPTLHWQAAATAAFYPIPA
jgi:ABC-type phosphate/phosphonate transport system substrate-binding protein